MHAQFPAVHVLKMMPVAFVVETIQHVLMHAVFQMGRVILINAVHVIVIAAMIALRIVLVYGAAL